MAPRKARSQRDRQAIPRREPWSFEMCRNETFHLSPAEWRRMTPEDQHRYVRRIVVRAHALRACAVYDLLIRGPLRLAAAAAGFIKRRRAMRELQALDDRALRDIGLNRSGIEAAVAGRGPLR